LSKSLYFPQTNKSKSVLQNIPWQLLVIQLTEKDPVINIHRHQNRQLFEKV